MKIILFATLAAAFVTGCGSMDLASQVHNATMIGARTHTGIGSKCITPHKWLECDTGRTPADTNGGGGGGE